MSSTTSIPTGNMKQLEHRIKTIEIMVRRMMRTMERITEEIVPPEQEEQERQKFFDGIHTIAQQANLSDNEALTVVRHAVQEVRAHYAHP